MDTLGNCGPCITILFLQDAHVQLITVRRKREDEEKRRLNEEVSSTRPFSRRALREQRSTSFCCCWFSVLLSSIATEDWDLTKTESPVVFSCSWLHIFSCAWGRSRWADYTFEEWRCLAGLWADQTTITKPTSQDFQQPRTWHQPRTGQCGSHIKCGAYIKCGWLHPAIIPVRSIGLASYLSLTLDAYML